MRQSARALLNSGRDLWARITNVNLGRARKEHVGHSRPPFSLALYRFPLTLLQCTPCSWRCSFRLREANVVPLSSFASPAVTNPGVLANSAAGRSVERLRYIVYIVRRESDGVRGNLYKGGGQAEPGMDGRKVGACSDAASCGDWRPLFGYADRVLSAAGAFVLGGVILAPSAI